MTKTAGISIFGMALAVIFWSFSGPSLAQKNQAPAGASNKGFTAGQDDGGNGGNGGKDDVDEYRGTGKDGKDIPSNKDVPSDNDIPDGKFPNKDGKFQAVPDENGGDNGANDADGDQGQPGIGKSQSQDDKRSGPDPDADLPNKSGPDNGGSDGGEPDKGDPAPVPEKELSDKDSLDTSLDGNDRNSGGKKGRDGDQPDNNAGDPEPENIRPPILNELGDGEKLKV